MRYINADKLQKDGWKLRREKHGLLTSTYETMELDCAPTADVRENIRANLVIAGYKRNGSTQWFECSVCGGAVDFTDNFCKHCGAQIKRG